jgi:hypothetical protein
MGAMRTPPTVAILVLLALLPLHLQLEAEAKVGVYTLSCNNQWKPKLEGFGHACMRYEHGKRTPPNKWELI